MSRAEKSFSQIRQIKVKSRSQAPTTRESSSEDLTALKGSGLRGDRSFFVRLGKNDFIVSTLQAPPMATTWTEPA